MTELRTKHMYFSAVAGNQVAIIDFGETTVKVRGWSISGNFDGGANLNDYMRIQIGTAAAFSTTNDSSGVWHHFEHDMMSTTVLGGMARSKFESLMLPEKDYIKVGPDQKIYANTGASAGETITAHVVIFYEVLKPGA